MNDPERVDLSPLDPARDPERWALLMEAARVRAEAVLLERASNVDALAVVGGWLRPILVAAAVALALLGAVRAGIGTRAAPAPMLSEAERLTALTNEFAGRGHMPTGPELGAALQAALRRGAP